MAYDFTLGFAPDGDGGFAWCIAQDYGGMLMAQTCGTAVNAEDAMTKVGNDLHGDYRVLAAGIGAPLFWTRTGSRNVDRIVRRALEDAAVSGGAPSGTVQELNAQRGASLVQGVLLARLLCEQFGAPVTETHPGALLRLQPELGADLNLPEEMHKAEISARAAWLGVTGAAGWRDLFADELNPVLPLGTPVSYWMPLPPG